MQDIAAYGAMFGPNSSIAIMLEAIDVFVAPANRLTKPIAAKVAISLPKRLVKATPAVDPIKNMGVNSTITTHRQSYRHKQPLNQKSVPDDICSAKR